MSQNDISYQNKDIASKVFAENFKDKSLEVYGLNLPKIVRVLPTNLPAISANELRIDDLFLLEDGKIMIIDYESAYNKTDKLKYVGYTHRVLERYFKEGKTDVKIIMVVIYTADVTPKQVDAEFDAGAIKLETEAAYLSQLKSDEIRKRLHSKVDFGQPLTDEELMEFIILPLTYKKELQKKAIEDTIELAKNISDEKTMAFVLSGILVFTDKVIDDELSKKTKEWIMMTKVGRLFAEEAEQEKAKLLTSMVESFAKSTGTSLEVACEKAGITMKDYEKAKKLLKTEETLVS